MKKIVIVAGDTSGDLYGGSLAKKIQEKSKTCQIYSFGGKVLAENSNQLADLVSNSVCGLIEIITSLARLKKLFEKTFRAIQKINPDLIILIDFPDFNLRLAKKINRKYPVFYYVSPQVWAWRKKRVKIIKKYTDKMIPIFRFETDFYQKENMDVSYFGHPLLEIIKKQNQNTKNIISFLPGSRQNEIKHHIRLLAGAKKIIQKQLPDYSFQVLKPEGTDIKLYEKFFPKEEIFTHSYRLLAQSKFIISASGTATIETAILEIPHLIIYKVNKLTWCVLKKIINTNFAGMLNILAGKIIVPELLQNKTTAENIAKTTLAYLQNKKAYDSFREKLKNATRLLYPDHGITQLAKYIIKYINQPNT